MSTPPISRRTILQLAGAGSLLAVGVGRAGAQARPGEPLRIWSNHPEWREALRKNLDAFEQQSGIKLMLEPKPGPEYLQVLSTAMQAGEGPDLPGIPPGPLVGQFLKSGAILDLTGRVHADRLIDIARQRVVRDGKVVGAPFGKYTVGLYYHVDILAKAGLKPPRTWDELKRAAQTLKQAGVVPLMMPARDGVIPAFYYMLAASSVLGPVGFAGLLAGQRKLTDPDLVDSAQLLVDLVPYYPEGFAGISYAEGKATFARGGTAMILGARPTTPATTRSTRVSSSTSSPFLRRARRRGSGDGLGPRAYLHRERQEQVRRRRRPVRRLAHHPRVQPPLCKLDHAPHGQGRRAWAEPDLGPAGGGSEARRADVARRRCGGPSMDGAHEEHAGRPAGPGQAGGARRGRPRRPWRGR